MTVTADGVVVFQAKANTVHARALKSIDAKLERMESALAKLDAERARAKADFVEAQRQALLAGEQIQAIIWQNFAAGAAAEVGFLALDLGVASLRGGFIGFTTKYLKERIFDPLKVVTDFNQAGTVLAREPTDANLRVLERTVKDLLTTRSRLEDFAARQKTRPGKLRGLAEGVAKDAVKVVLKKALDARELEAFIAYFEKDLYARAVTAHFMAVSTEYWNVNAGILTDNHELDVPGYQLRANADRADAGGKLLLEVR